MPPADLDDRAVFIERVLASTVTLDAYAAAAYTPRASSAGMPMDYAVDVASDRVEVTMRAPDGRLTKQLTFTAEGAVRATFTWDATAFDPADWFCTELSLDGAHEVTADDAATIWSHPIETVAKSEKGLDRTVQGRAYLVRWPVTAGRGTVELP
jgi:hypothetical protein